MQKPSTWSSVTNVGVYAVVILVLLFLVGILDWYLGSGNNGYGITYCSYLLQRCGNLWIPIREAFGYWVLYALIPTVYFLTYIFVETKKSPEKRSSYVLFFLLLLISVFLQGLLALYLPGVTSIEYSAATHPGSFFIEHQTIAVFTVLIPGLILGLVAKKVSLPNQK
jgi:hypothetical protein